MENRRLVLDFQDTLENENTPLNEGGVVGGLRFWEGLKFWEGLGFGRA